MASTLQQLSGDETSSPVFAYCPRETTRKRFYCCRVGGRLVASTGQRMARACGWARPRMLRLLDARTPGTLKGRSRRQDRNGLGKRLVTVLGCHPVPGRAPISLLRSDDRRLQRMATKQFLIAQGDRTGWVPVASSLTDPGSHLSTTSSIQCRISPL